MKYQFYNELPQEAKMIREKVFMQEQGFHDEFDERDHHCLHFVLFKDQQPIGCARMYEDHRHMVLGRIAVLKEYRHLHLGSEILKQLENKASELGFNVVELSAQVQAMNFYIKNGYQAYGEEYLDEFCPHIHMQKQLLSMKE